jgi:hypothetical protein
MNLAGFAESIGGEFVAGCLIGTIDGKRQYLHRDGEFTPVGRAAYLAWEGNQPEPEVEVAIATPGTKPSRKLHKSAEE